MVEAEGHCCPLELPHNREEQSQGYSEGLGCAATKRHDPHLNRNNYSAETHDGALEWDNTVARAVVVVDKNSSRTLETRHS